MHRKLNSFLESTLMKGIGKYGLDCRIDVKSVRLRNCTIIRTIVVGH